MRHRRSCRYMSPDLTSIQSLRLAEAGTVPRPVARPRVQSGDPVVDVCELALEILRISVIHEFPDARTSAELILHSMLGPVRH